MKSKPQEATTSQQLPIPMEATHLSNAYLLKGNTMYALSIQHRFPIPPAEKKFRLAKEMQQIVISNSSILFSEKTVLVSPVK